MNPDPIVQWLLAPSTGALDHAGFVESLCERLVAAGLPLSVASLSLRTRHPEIYVLNGRWTRDEGTTITRYPRNARSHQRYLDSPIRVVRETQQALRIDLGAENVYYPVCAELKAAGMTDYFIQPMLSGRGGHSFASWCTDQPGGFTDEQIDVLQAIAPTLALRMDSATAHLATHLLLQVYLGRNAAHRVLGGAFERGSGERIEAAIWFCDLRGFTRLSDHTDVEQVIDVLDRYFEVVAEQIRAGGGEILKFIGDAVLAVFPIAGSPEAACGHALQAAEAALADAHALGPDLSFGIALHRGEVFYGNIGATERLDFTVIGPAVNEASRVEGMCKSLQCDLLLTEDFARHVDGRRLRSLGRHSLRGVDRTQELFTVSTDEHRSAH